MHLSIFNMNHQACIQWKTDAYAHTQWHAFSLSISHTNVGRNNVLAISRMPVTLMHEL